MIVLSAEQCVKFLAAAADVVKRHDGSVLVIEAREMPEDAGGFFAAPGQDGRALLLLVAVGHPLVGDLKKLVRLDS